MRINIGPLGITISLFGECGKVKYGHKETADRAVAAMAAKGSPGLESYECEYCGKWHIGHGDPYA